MTQNLCLSPHLSPIFCLFVYLLVFCDIGVVNTLLVPHQQSLALKKSYYYLEARLDVRAGGIYPLPVSLQFISLAAIKTCLLLCPHTYNYIVPAQKEQDTTGTLLQRLAPNTANYPSHRRSPGFISAGPTPAGSMLTNLCNSRTFPWESSYLGAWEPLKVSVLPSVQN